MLATALPIKAQIDLILFSLEALAHVGSAEVVALADAMGYEAYLPGRVGGWRLRPSSPLRRGRSGPRKLAGEEARALALICSRLAQRHQQTIRTAVEHWQQQVAQQHPPHHDPLLGDYLDRFSRLYTERMANPSLEGEALAQLGLDLLVDLLFYSTPQGSRRLWMALLERTVPPTEPPLQLLEPEPTPRPRAQLPTLFPYSDASEAS